MAYSLLSTQTIYALATLTAVGAIVMLWQYRERTGALALLLMMGAMAIWNGAVLLLLSTESATVASLSLRTTSVGITFVSMLKLVFVLEYTGREHLLRPRIVGALAIPPVAVVILSFTNPADLIYTTLQPAEAGPLPIEYEFGPGALVYTVYAYGINVVTTAMVLAFVYRSRAVYRGQSLALLGGALAPWIAHAVYAADLTAIDPMPVGGILSSVLFAVAIGRYRLLDLMPIARNRVLDTVADGIFVVDTDDRLIDVNPAGRRLLASVDVETESLVGRSFPSLFDETGLRDWYEAVTNGRAETATELSVGATHVRITATPIDDDRDRRVGWLLVARDVTERKRHEEQLERQNSRLQRFASLVSHDLRNPLNVADGYLEMARETDDDAHLEEVAQSHERMETIIDDVLTLAREGADVADPEPVPLERVARHAWNGVETGGASIGIDGDATILADPERLQRALENLFRNAVEHGSTSHSEPGGSEDAVEHGSTSPASHTQQDAVEHGSTSPASHTQRNAVPHGNEAGDGTDLEITVGTIDDDGDGSIEGFFVADDGIGIPACRREQVLESGYTTGENGTGLGLSIVEEIAAAHNWSVHVAESETGGARFEFRGVESITDSGGSEPDAESETVADSSDDEAPNDDSDRSADVPMR
ncbi:histidine kinase N-terminal 7TM domain-containing protein [Haloterrigena alkaliphila]|uniref:histidine kinase n=1 Tax=Haloterrigena alkaliphila TaxID=2816475 RepID=A0A8A2VFF2_9EURY|nr:histidine kinase N-terminal 7TM domain-containing protein [Haloterrigena alkaliphila]QSW99397.1 ATP-binding protein [Haloterrigena alkaliphila]